MADLHQKETATNEFQHTIGLAEHALGYRLTIHNVTGILKRPDGRQLLDQTRGMHEHPLCRLCKAAAIANCLRDCQRDANARSRELKIPWLHTCWAGLTELVVPVTRNSIYFFTVFAGVFRLRGHTRPSGSPVPEQAFAALPVPDENTLIRMGDFVTTVAHGLLARVEDLNRLQDAGGGRRDQVRRFLYFYSRDRVSLKDLAAYLHLSNDRTSHLVTELFGVPFRTLLLQERLKNAHAMLLSSPEWDVGTIAMNAGVRDEYFFNRAFKKMYGLPPGRYRKEHLKKTP